MPRPRGIYKFLRYLILFAVGLACRGGLEDGSREVGLTATEFTRLMQILAEGWSTQDVDMALSCFAEDAVYMEPPDVQFYQGHQQLRPYFAALKPGTFMRFHNLAFNQESQVGMGEYTFGVTDKATADHGVAVVELRNKKIAFWREYQRKGSFEFEKFLAGEDKVWQWHIGNYP